MSRMGDLAATDVYNAFDVPLEQSTNVGWANRLGEILTTRPPDNPAVAYKTPYFDITEGDIGRATEAAMGVSGGGMTVKGQPGIRAYHSSPHDFDKFDLAKIGTGEGAQAYGHGLYFAESPAVSGQGGQYWNQFLNRFEGYEGEAARTLQRAGFDREAALKASQRDIDQLLTNYGDKLGADPRYDVALERMRKEHALLSDKLPVGPRTYEVNINADPAHMLDWEKPLSGHGAQVQDAIRAAHEKATGRLNIAPYLTGQEVYGTLQDAAALASGRVGHGSSPSAFKPFKVEAAEALREAGIPGIKYLDEGSRFSKALYNDNPIANEARRFVEAAGGNSEKAAELFYKSNPVQSFGASERDEIRRLIQMAGNKPTSNYVVFDPGIIDIMKKYGIAGAVPTAMGALAAQDQYRGQ